jgi:hypothetical protein
MGLVLAWGVPAALAILTLALVVHHAMTTQRIRWLLRR